MRLGVHAFDKRLLPRLRNRAVHATFPLWQRMGLHVTVNHYYQPIPDTRFLPPSLWAATSDLPGIDMNEAGQISLLETLDRGFRHEWTTFPLWDRGDGAYYVNNHAFESVDGEVLYGMLRHLRPKRVIEVGSGFSTLLTLQALAANREEGFSCQLTAIEPFPPNYLERFAGGALRLVRTGVQEVALSEFSALDAGDVLFIDSTHVLRIGSDVQYELLEVLPRLKPGVVIHVHDIFLPAEYPQAWVLQDYRFWNEQYVLQALLTWTRGLEVLWGGSFMHLRHPELLRRAFPSYVPGQSWPGSFWMRRTEPPP